jgi:hypothetical protein
MDKLSLTTPSETADGKVHVTFFKDKLATSLTTEQLTLEELRRRVLNEARRVKGKLPLLKLAVFGTKRSDKTACVLTRTSSRSLVSN